MLRALFVVLHGNLKALRNDGAIGERIILVKGIKNKGGWDTPLSVLVATSLIRELYIILFNRRPLFF